MSISRDRRRLPALALTAAALTATMITAPAANASVTTNSRRPLQATTSTHALAASTHALAAPTAALGAVQAVQAALVLHQRRVGAVMGTAAALKGRPYRFGAVGPRAFDCSGYTKYVFARNGIVLPRTAAQQYRASRRVSKAAARPGDLVFLGGAYAQHVGIYAGNGMMWHSPRTGKTVRLVKIWTSNWSAGRVIA